MMLQLSQATSVFWWAPKLGLLKGVEHTTHKKILILQTLFVLLMLCHLILLDDSTVNETNYYVVVYVSFHCCKHICFFWCRGSSLWALVLDSQAKNTNRCCARPCVPAHVRKTNHLSRLQGLEYPTWLGKHIFLQNFLQSSLLQWQWSYLAALIFHAELQCKALWLRTSKARANRRGHARYDSHHGHLRIRGSRVCGHWYVWLWVPKNHFVCTETKAGKMDR